MISVFQLSFLLLVLLVMWESSVLRRVLVGAIEIESRRIERKQRAERIAKEAHSAREIDVSYAIAPPFIGRLWDSEEKLTSEDLPWEDFSFVFFSAFDGKSEYLLRQALDGSASYVYLVFSGGMQDVALEELLRYHRAKGRRFLLLDDTDHSVGKSFEVKRFPATLTFDFDRKIKSIKIAEQAPAKGAV